MSNLIEELIDADLEFLIPADYHSHLQYSDDCYDDYEDSSFTGLEIDKDYGNNFRLQYEYEPDVFDDCYEYEDNEDEYEDDDRSFGRSLIFQNQPENLKDMKAMFGREDEADYDFLHHNFAELLGITKPQLKFVDQDFLMYGNIREFVDFVQNKSNVQDIPDVQQRIKAAQTLSTIREKNYYHTSNNEKVNRENLKVIHNQIFSIALHKDTLEAIGLIRLYQDYMDMYFECVAYNNTLPEDQRRCYPITIKPSHIKDWHDKAVQDFRAYQTMVQKENEERYSSLIRERFNNKSYNRFFFSSDSYLITGPSCYKDFVKEGTALNHCVENYSAEHANGDTNIYFLREKDNPKEPFYTIEVRPSRKYCYLEQCFGKNNTIEKTEDCRQFILGWAKKNGIRIKCSI